MEFNWGLLFTVIDLLILYVLLRKFLFGRVDAVIKERQKEAEADFQKAQKEQDKARQLQKQYEDSLQGIEEQRKQVLDGMDLKDRIQKMIADAIERDVQMTFGEHKHITNEQYLTLLGTLEGTYFPKYAVKYDAAEAEKATAEEMTERFTKAAMIWTGSINWLS